MTTTAGVVRVANKFPGGTVLQKELQGFASFVCFQNADDMMADEYYEATPLFAAHDVMDEYEAPPWVTIFMGKMLCHPIVYHFYNNDQ